MNPEDFLKMLLGGQNQAPSEEQKEEPIKHEGNFYDALLISEERAKEIRQEMVEMLIKNGKGNPYDVIAEMPRRFKNHEQLYAGLMFDRTYQRAMMIQHLQE